MENFRRAVMGLGKPLATSFGEELVMVVAVAITTTAKLDVQNAGLCNVR